MPPPTCNTVRHRTSAPRRAARLISIPVLIISPETNPEQLLAGVLASQLRFLQTELQVGHTMLDAAATTQDAEASARRRARAKEAYDEVARRLTADGALSISDAERERLRVELAALEARLHPAPGTSG